MKKVLIVAHMQSHIAQFHKPLMKMLKEENAIVHVAANNNLSIKNGLKIEYADKIFNIPFKRFPLNFGNINAYNALGKLIEKNKYDIVHCNTPSGGLLARIACINKRKSQALKVFYTAHGFHFYAGAKVFNWILFYPFEKWFAHITDKLITITEEDYNYAKSNLKTHVEHIYGVGVDSNRFFPISTYEKLNMREISGFHKDSFIILCIGELNKNKNQKTVIKAFNEFNKIVPNSKLILAGNGPNEQKLKELIKSFNLEGNTYMPGYESRIEKLIWVSDVIVSVSYREGLPLNIIEAYLCKKPVIASNNRGHRELITIKTGYTIKPDDHFKLAEYIIKLYNNKEMRMQLGTNGYRKMKKYISKSVSKQLKGIYEM